MFGQRPAAEVLIVLDNLETSKEPQDDIARKLNALLNPSKALLTSRRRFTVDLFAVPGLGADTLLTVTSEVGFDMSPWKTVKHFTSWLSLCPGTRISGGKELKKRGKRKANRAAQAFRVGAATLGRSQSALGAFYRRIKARHGGQHAVTATAHKIARIYYTMLTEGTAYVELGQQAYEQKYQQRRLAHLQKQAKALGLHLVPCAAP